MKQVFPVETGLVSSNGLSRIKGFISQIGFKMGIIEKTLKPGIFIVALPNDLKVTVRGSESLKLGSKVKIQMPLGSLRGKEIPARVESPKLLGDSGFQWSALIPLGFGGKKAMARLEVFVERPLSGGRAKGNRAVYLVFTVQTENKGEIQWNIHLKGRQVTLQVYVSVKENQKEELKNLIQEVEKSLKNRGFMMTAPTIFLNRPFNIPAGFRLNVRG